MQINKSTKYCTQCQRQRPLENGANVSFNNGKNYRWRCGECHEKINGRVNVRFKLSSANCKPVGNLHRD